MDSFKPRLYQSQAVMSTDDFWHVCKVNEKLSNRELCESIIQRLSEVAIEEIIGFSRRYKLLINKLAVPDILLAGDLIYEGYCSDDTFLYFRVWLVSQGKDLYCEALKNPDILGQDLHEFENTEPFLYIGIKAYCKKTGRKDFYKV